jgi:soluble lytic murein transglycosylase-like protein
MSSKVVLLTVVTLLISWSQATRADVWGFVDASGVVHLANEKIDERYEIYFKSSEAIDSRNVSMPGQSPSIGVSKRLLAYFDVSPEVKAIKPLMREVASRYQLDMELLQALIAVESGYNAQAVSPKGAVGLMQLIPATAERYGVRADKKRSIEQKLMDPRTNIRAGAQYLADLMRSFPGRLDLALAAYNAGEGAVLRHKRSVPPFKETQAYVQTVTELYHALKPQRVVGNRVRIELKGRNNMPPPVAAP